ncbi:DUF4352 domain-containing protein [Micromonospora sp. S4605]|uniref:DUF4352 domain-containing protein n=1 Tax=Micromonospora sp. S4605 TaxID=1420897 RepID=UPI000D6F1979|nr:DUF4352 domain-containing protein [Micromonospora sp. S4605]PWU48114.1 DUF4352 domain-containing protein [Micromonospora sp. S4605]
MTTPSYPPPPGQDPQWQQPGQPDPTQQFPPQPGEPTQQWQQQPIPLQQWQQPPGPGQQWQQAGVPVAPSKRKPWLVPVILGVAVVFVLCCGGIFALGATSDPKPAADSSPSAKAPATSAPASPAPTVAKAEPAKTSAAPSPAGDPVFKIGQKVRGGDFEFTVHGVKCGIRSVGTEFLNTQAQGQFCRVDMTVKNVTKSAHLFHADSTVTAHDATGREYSADGEAGIYGNDNAKGFLDEINPGNSVRAYVFFDVPKGTKLSKIVFDAGLFTFAEDAVVTL